MPGGAILMDGPFCLWQTKKGGECLALAAALSLGVF